MWPIFVPRTNQRVRRQRKNLRADFFFCQAGELFGAAHRTGENRIADHGHARRVLRPVANDVGHPVFGMTGRVAVGDAQTAEMNEIVRPIALIHRRIFRARMKFHFRNPAANRFERGNVVGMRVRDEQVFELNFVPVDQLENRLRVEARVE